MKRLVPSRFLSRSIVSAVAFAVLSLAGDVMCTAEESSSWIFRRSRYSHDPATGARVAQYARKMPVEPLDDPRHVTSGYRTNRTNLRGPSGSVDTYYEVSSYGNDRGGLDAQWERFHDAWLQSAVSGSYSYDPRFGFDPRFGDRQFPGYGSGYGQVPYRSYGAHGGFVPPSYGQIAPHGRFRNGNSHALPHYGE